MTAGDHETCAGIDRLPSAAGRHVRASTPARLYAAGGPANGESVVTARPAAVDFRGGINRNAGAARG